MNVTKNYDGFVICVCVGGNKPFFGVIFNVILLKILKIQTASLG